MSKKELAPGIYEKIVNRNVKEYLAHLSPKQFQLEKIDTAEGAKILSAYLARIITRGLSDVAAQCSSSEPQKQLAAEIALANKIIALVENETKNEDLPDEYLVPPGEELLEIAPQNSLAGTVKNEHLPRPQTSLTETSLFTGAKKEPSMMHELRMEIRSANRIDMLVSFIKWSGLRLIYDDLRFFAEHGGQLRLIATSYMGATDAKAIDAIAKLPHAEVRISYDTKRTRLHAKAYLFYRSTGYDTAYIGSSNMSRAALSTGLEWNVKITHYDSPHTMEKVQATFETYWHTEEFEPYTEEKRAYLHAAIEHERHPDQVQEGSSAFFFDVHPFGYQRQILDDLLRERLLHHNYKNLIVAATGTGKTVLAAFDYRRFCQETPGPHRLLFVAHREEILAQSRACFRNILRDENFGGLFVGSERPTSDAQMEHLFLSIQTFSAKDWTTQTTPDAYDYIVVDEVHHAAAHSYKQLFSYYHPKILLGLTATPERMDGEDITGSPGKISYMLQKDLLLQHKKIIDNVSLPLVLGGMKKAEARKKADALFAEFGLDGTQMRYPSQLSGGMRQRAALLRTYMASEGVALLDEPFSALDTLTKSSMHRWYLDIMNQIDLSTIFITHDIDEAILLSDRIYILKGRPGRITCEIPVTEPKPRSPEFNLSESFLAYKRRIISEL